ncbi:signal peptidase I [Corynebacterium renale]|nr:signal peptidase I [Corynebacterium renale]STC96710.1 signal peptidase I [Corynebacterium renale]
MRNTDTLLKYRTMPEHCFLQSRDRLVIKWHSVNTTAGDSTQRTDGEAKKQTPWYIEIPVLIVVTFLAVALIHAFIGRVYVIPSASMEPTLHGCQGCDGDRIAAQKVSYYFTEPEPGDVIVFEGTDSWNQGFTTNRSENPAIRGLQNLGSYIGIVAPDENILVKRVIATGGQTVSCQAGDPSVMVDGQPTDQSFTLQPTQFPVDPSTGSEACGGPYFGPITVPDDHLFMMGDNRTNSLDSRYHVGDQHQGTIPLDNVRGKVEFRFWPLNRIGVVSDPDIQEAA